MTNQTPSKQNQFFIYKCNSCYKEYTQSMMMEIKIYSYIGNFKTHLCIKCYNLH